MADAQTASRKATVQCPFCGRLNRVDLARAADRPKCGECGRPILLDRPVHLTDESFDRVIADAQVPVLVDFYADWCGPCKMMAPVLDEFARQHTGEILVLKLDTEANRMTPARFGIRGIPTLIVFEKGQEARRQVGAVQASDLDKLVPGLATARA
jgi:thioredoxin 2